MMVRNNGEFTVQGRFPFAQAVYLLGEFNRWSTTATPMSYVGGGVWEATLRLEAGNQRLAYFVWQHGNPFGQVIHLDAKSPSVIAECIDAVPV
jgi:1,4-alpha-glucan branching enzyme